MLIPINFRHLNLNLDLIPIHVMVPSLNMFTNRPRKFSNRLISEKKMEIENRLKNSKKNFLSTYVRKKKLFGIIKLKISFKDFGKKMIFLKSIDLYSCLVVL